MSLTPHRRVTLALVLASSPLLLPPSVPAQAPQPSGVTLVEPAPPLLPKQFGAWQQTPATPDTAPDAALQTMLKEDGLTRSAAANYARDGSAETVDARAFQFIDATGAFSAFTGLRGPGDRSVPNLGTAAIQHGDHILIWSGPSIVLADFHGSRRIADLSDLVATLPKIGGAKGAPPLLPTLLPAKGLQSDSVKYALGPESYQTMGGVLPANLVGFDKSAEVVTASYSGHRSLTLLLYPTPQIAGEHGRAIEAEMNHEGPAAGTVKLRREGELVLLTTGAWTAADAQQTIDNIHMRTELTWNKPIQPEFHAEVRKTASLLVSILELSGLLMVAAIVLGFFFGGGRAAIRVLQGKPAATEPEFLSINLRDRPGDSGTFKPLH